MVTCWACRQEKSEAEFYNAKKDRRCKECARARAREYAATHRDQAIARYRKWRKANLAKAAEYQREWRKKHPREAKKIRQRAINKKLLYRTVAAGTIGRELGPGESVHHINCDHRDNRPENLHVYPSRAGHGRAHGSLGKLVKSLMEAGHVVFDRGAGVYRLGTPG